MSNPTKADVHVDVALTNISIAYMQNPSNYVAGTVFPSIAVGNQSNKYFKFDKNDWYRDDAVLKRAPGTESAGSGMNLSTDSYSCDVFATHVDLDYQTLANADSVLDLERAAAQIVSQRILINEERQFSTDYFSTSIWGTDAVGGTDFTLWSDYAGSDPATDVETAKTTVLQNTGFEPNTMLVSHKVHAKLRHHPLIKEQFKYTSSQSLTKELLAQFFEVDRYLVSKAVYSNSAESASTETYAFAFGDNALLCYVSPVPGLMVPSAGYNYIWSGLTGVNNLGFRIKNFEMTELDSTRIEGDTAYDMKVVGSDLGYFFSGAIA